MKYRFGARQGQRRRLGALGFVAQFGAPLSTIVESNTITLSDLVGSPAMTISGGEYSKNGAAYASGATTITNGDTVKVRLTTSAINSTASIATLTIGGVPYVFTVTTLVIVVVAPAQVGTVTATPGNTQVALAWSAPANGGSAITDYLVEYKLSASGTWLTFADGVSSSTGATVTGLTNSSAYDFRVSAINAVGTGTASPVASATPVDVVTPPPVQPFRIATAPNYYAIGQSSAVGATRGYIARRPIYIGRGGAVELRASFANTFATRVAESGNSITVRSIYLEKGDGSSSVQMTFDGGAATTKTLAWLDTDIQSDAILPSAFGLSEFPEHSLWWERVVFDVPLTTDKYPSAVPVRTAYSGFTSYRYDPASFPSQDASGTGALVGTGKTAIINGTKVWGAIWIGRSASQSRSYLCRGDSWTRDSDNDSAAISFPLRLFSDVFERALVNEAGTQFEPFLNCGVYGSGVPSGADPCLAYYKYATDFYDELGLNSPGSAAALQAGLATMWASYKAESPTARIWRSKYIAPTTSTDNFVTEANQTIPAGSLPGGVYYATNDWFDTKVADATLTGVIPFGRLRGVDFYKWRVNDSVANWSVGSSHPSSAAGIPLLAAEIRSVMVGNATSAPVLPVLTTAASDTTLTVTWPINNATDHLVEISPAGLGSWTSIHTYDTVCAHCFTGLTASTSYDVRITAINIKGTSAAATTTQSTAAQPTLVLDGISATIDAAYSSQRLRGAYTGPAYRVMRTSDRSEMNVYYSGSNDLDTAWLLAWVGSSSARVKREYDQSGNVRNQAPDYPSFSVGTWPFLVITGTLQTVNGYACPVLSTTAAYQATTLSASLAGARTVIAVVKPTSLATTQSILGGGNVGGFGMDISTGGAARIFKQGSSTIATSSLTMAGGDTAQLVASYDLTNYAFRKNGVAANSGTNAQTFTGGLFSPLGNGLSGIILNSMVGQIPQTIVLSGTVSGGDLVAVEATRTHWGAP